MQSFLKVGQCAWDNVEEDRESEEEECPGNTNKDNRKANQGAEWGEGKTENSLLEDSWGDMRGVYLA